MSCFLGEVKLSGGQQGFQAGVQGIKISGIFAPLIPCCPVCSLCPLWPFPCGDQQYKPSNAKAWVFVFPDLSWGEGEGWAPFCTAERGWL